MSITKKVLCNGNASDGDAIQKAINECTASGGGVIELENGKTYIVNREIVVKGSNITINGHDSILRKTAPSSDNYYGALFNIYGESSPATKIYVNNLNLVFTQERTKAETLTNGFAICNAHIVKLNECSVYGAPQTSFAINATVGNKHIDDVSLYRCVGRNSKKHTFRLSAIETSTFFKAKMVECEGINTLEYDKGYNMAYKSPQGRRVHLLVNVSNTNLSDDQKKNFSQVIENCKFDSTGGAYVTGPCPKVEFIQCYFPWERGSGAEKANVTSR